MYGMTDREIGGNVREDGYSLLGALAMADAEEVRLPKHRPDLVEYVDRAIRGGFPAVALQAMSAEMRDAWLDSYVAQLITRDAHELEPGRDSSKLGRYLQALAAHSATEIDHKTLYDAAGIDRRTAVAYDSLLESLFVVEQVQSWDANRLKRLTSTPKRYLVDPSMMAAVLGATAASVLNDGTLLGRTIDTFVTSQLRPEVTLLSRRSGRYHVRTKNGREEIDILIETPDGRLIALEVKATAGPSRADARHLAWIRDSIGDRFVAGAVLHTGPDVFSLGDRILAVPICAFWG
jgi:predicted AAA+ superfamily ATPase